MKRGKDLYRKKRREKKLLDAGRCLKCKNHYASLFCRKCNDLTCGCSFPCCTR